MLYCAKVLNHIRRYNLYAYFNNLKHLCYIRTIGDLGYVKIKTLILIFLWMIFERKFNSYVPKIWLLFFSFLCDNLLMQNTISISVQYHIVDTTFLFRNNLRHGYEWWLRYLIKIKEILFMLIIFRETETFLF